MDAVGDFIWGFVIANLIWIVAFALVLVVALGIGLMLKGSSDRRYRDQREEVAGLSEEEKRRRTGSD